jgi:cysteine dioxygenase
MKYTKYWIPFPFIDIYFIVWKPNALSKIHNHSKNGCYMLILKGDIKEEIYNKKLNIIGSNYYSTFDISYINDNIGYHRIKNTNQYTYSLHFYHPRNHITTYFD